MLKSDIFLLKCPTYESYLDSFVTQADGRYLRNGMVGRMLVTLGFRTTGVAPYTPNQFTRLKEEIYLSLYPRKKANILFSTGLSSSDPLIKGLAHRELPNVQKAISTIIFIRFRNKNGFEVSGFIDYEHSLRSANMGDNNFHDWAGIFEEKKLLRPHKKDLSFFDWHNGKICHNNSDNFIVNHDKDHGLLFIHRGDHKKVCVNSSSPLFNKNSTYEMVLSNIYGEIIFFDHVVRKKI